MLIIYISLSYVQKIKNVDMKRKRFKLKEEETI